MPNNGALFVGYVMTVAFISSPLELLRIPELIVYVYRRLTAVTKLEKEKALNKVRSTDPVLRYCALREICWMNVCSIVCIYIHN